MEPGGLTSSIKRWIGYAWRWLLSWLRPNSRFADGDTYRIVHASDDPEDLEPRTICVAGENEHDRHAMLRCPCGCAATISLILLRDDRPYWVLIAQNGLATLNPSIWRTSGCRSHFFIRRGRVEWCAHRGRSVDRGN